MKLNDYMQAQPLDTAGHIFQVLQGSRVKQCVLGKQLPICSQNL